MTNSEDGRSSLVSGSLLKMQVAEQVEDKEEAKGQNFVINDAHRDTAIEIFESYFARAYKRKENAPMTEKRFIRAIERARKRENFEDAYVE